MNLDKKDLIKKIVILFSPIFTLIMYSLSYIAKYWQQISDYTDAYGEYISYFELLKSDFAVAIKILPIISLIGVFSCIILYVLGVIIKNKEKLFTKIGAIVLVVATGILALSPIFKASETFSSSYKLYSWINFMTIPYGLLIIYNVVCLILVCKKEVK